MELFHITVKKKHKHKNLNKSLFFYLIFEQNCAYIFPAKKNLESELFHIKLHKKNLIMWEIINFSFFVFYFKKYFVVAGHLSNLVLIS